MQLVYITCSLILLSSAQSFIHAVNFSKISSTIEPHEHTALESQEVAEQLPQAAPKRSGFPKKPPERDTHRNLIDLNSPPTEEAFDGLVTKPKSLARTDAPPSQPAKNAANNQAPHQFDPPLSPIEDLSGDSSAWLDVDHNYGSPPMLYHPGYNILSFVPLPIKEDGGLNTRGWFDGQPATLHKTSGISSAISQQPLHATTPLQGNTVWPSSIGLSDDRWMTPARPSALAFETVQNQLEHPSRKFPMSPSVAPSQLVDLGPARPSYGPMQPLTTVPWHQRPKTLKLRGASCHDGSNRLKVKPYLPQMDQREQKNNIPSVTGDAQQTWKMEHFSRPKCHPNFQKQKLQTVDPEEVSDNFSIVKDMLF